MKTNFIIPVIAMAVVINTHTNAIASNCISWGEANTFSTKYNTQTKVEQCRSANEDVGWNPNCATLDLSRTFITENDDGTCTRLESCATCPSGYTLDSVSDGTLVGDICYYDGDDFVMKDMWETQQYTPIELYACVPECATCTNCTSSDWSSYGTGYEKQIFRECDCGVCNASTIYRCAAGYWGSSRNGTSGCSRCPEWVGVYSNSARTVQVYGTSSAGATYITQCYIPSGTYYDETGKFELTANCPYRI